VVRFFNINCRSNKKKKWVGVAQRRISGMSDQVYPDEINLNDYLKIIYKWKLLIIAICLISAFATFIVTSRLVPTTYEVSAVITPESLSYTADGRSMRLDLPVNIHGLIENGLFNQKIIEALKLDPEKFSAMRFKTQIYKNTEFIRVTYETPESEIGKAIMAELINQISKFYKDKFILNQEEASKKIDKLKDTLILQQSKKAKLQAQKFRLQNQKERLENNTEALQNQKERLQNNKERKNNEWKSVENQSELSKKQLAIYMTSEQKLQDLLKKAEENMNVLVIQKDELFKKEAKVDTASLIFYSNTIQQSIYGIDKLHADIENRKMTQENIRNQLINNDIRLTNIDKDVKDIDTQIVDVAVNTKILHTQIEDVDSQIKESIIQEKDIDIENLAYLKEIESLTKRMTTSSERIKVIQEPDARMVEKQTGVKVFGAGIAALFFGIMLVIFIEFIRQGPNRHEKRQDRAI
jgi:hypothetical protein